MKKPWTHDHEDLDLAYPMVAEKPPLGLIHRRLILIGAAVVGWAIVWGIVWGIARAIDMNG